MNTINNINELLGNDNFLSISKKYWIFLTPHNGRESCYSFDLVSHIKPKITIISDKSNNTDTSAVDKYSKNSFFKSFNLFFKLKIFIYFLTNIFIETKIGYGESYYN